MFRLELRLSRPASTRAPAPQECIFRLYILYHLPQHRLAYSQHGQQILSTSHLYSSSCTILVLASLSTRFDRGLSALGKSSSLSHLSSTRPRRVAVNARVGSPTRMRVCLQLGCATSGRHAPAIAHPRRLRSAPRSSTELNISALLRALRDALLGPHAASLVCFTMNGCVSTSARLMRDAGSLTSSLEMRSRASAVMCDGHLMSTFEIFL